jgi:hypothetical protein
MSSVGRILLFAAVAMASWGASVLRAEQPSNDKVSTSITKSLLTTNIGMGGIVYARYAGGPLEAKPMPDDSPITLSIGEVTATPVTGGQSATRIYQLHFVGTRAGEFDLRDYLERVDGRPITDLEPLRVSVAERLPPDYAGDLESVSPVKLPWAWPYQALVGAAAVAWTIPAIWFVAARLRRRKQIQPTRGERPVTLVEQLRPLVALAIAGQLTADDQARLERLLIGYWRDALELGGLPTTAALERMRGNRRAGELLRQLELWLYEKPGREEVDVAAILAPYENVAATPPQAEALARKNVDSLSPALRSGVKAPLTINRSAR